MSDKGVEFRGLAFMTELAGLTALTVLESTLPSFCLSYKIEHKEATATPLNSTPLSDILIRQLQLQGLPLELSRIRAMVAIKKLVEV